MALYFFSSYHFWVEKWSIFSTYSLQIGKGWEKAKLILVEKTFLRDIFFVFWIFLSENMIWKKIHEINSFHELRSCWYFSSDQNLTIFYLHFQDMKPHVSKVTALFLLSQVFLIITHVPLVRLLAWIIFAGDSNIFTERGAARIAEYSSTTRKKLTSSNIVMVRKRKSIKKKNICWKNVLFIVMDRVLN